MNYIAWYFAIGMVFTLIFMGLLHKELKKKNKLSEIVTFFIDDILFWPIKLLGTIRATYDFILDIIIHVFNYFRGNFRGNF